MEIFVYHTPDQVPDLSKQARKGGLQLEMPACAIVIDVLRATTTMATALQSGAEAIQVFADIDELFRISQRWPAEQRLLAGERGGEKLEDFDLGNSPSECTPARVGGKRLFMSTTNGTRALERVRTVPILLTAALTNRWAVVRYLLEEQPRTVWIVAAGWRGGFSLEDTICAGAIACALRVERGSDCAGDDESIAAMALFDQWQSRLPQLLRYAHHGRGLAALGCDVDLDYCARIDSVNVVPVQIEPGVLKAAELAGI
ncbi:MAG: 2-phosphosulfolactate phosphatase family protein [Candidatus Competibacteraceae bacterium]|uniref:Probable 2-phosphosulfolactate phosphatase n=1 Tax=Candidatus Contendobacter odensis Run_B_J11 TaxID=1400861 RepID=A0A7U7J285_9GAMM|nr:2-phosphosulfolactate phosphatase family protein [Candidatus Contendobacter odensis]MBK8535242.1 2-phosphosulfolactate phosphatase family protein [Candidatus Competibacteraceae bacterium]MBK8752907.1 2-phosphosulfolactate phosphatase family protein [Candidatus Competibacteraceae bacterium]CDH44805.1 putative 2-phosphosulfolactate phosphatase [Candidatus Contendobacter odensis Run_B_J11]